MKNILLLICLFLLNLAYAQTPNARVSIIPEPQSMKLGKGYFQLPSNISIEIDNAILDKNIVEAIQTPLVQVIGAKVTITNNLPNATIRLKHTTQFDESLGKEGYQLTITSQAVQILANESAGLFYGVQTFLQLLPKEIMGVEKAVGVKWVLPFIEIKDQPRFAWRGLMFDVARHFFSKNEVKKFIDEMVLYKYNLLHLHLTDDEGWRIEIKGLPKLTELGAWNVKKTGYFGRFSAPTANEPKDYGGFYTQADIKELVAYAKSKFVNILPEIDVPGHSLAAVVSYPELSCTPEASTYRVRSGEVIMDWSQGNPPIALVDNTLCPANEKVYDFLDKVMTEVAALFPFEYIHVGGDECPKNFWQKTPAIHALMQKEGLKSMHEVQSYFEKRLEKIISSKGKKMMGWDEILEGGLAPSAAVMSWRGMKGGIEAAKMKHPVVMSPTTHAYLDYMQGDPIVEPRVYASLRLNKTYEFDPLPDGVDPSYILGGQGNLWSEQIYNRRHQQYMTWPRGFAIAESLWSPKEKKNWNHFINKVEKHFERFTVADIKYAPSLYDPIFKPKFGEDKNLLIELDKELADLNIHYSFDNSFPDHHYPIYQSPLTPPKDAVMLKLVTYRKNKQMGRIIAIPIADLEKRITK